MVEKVLNTIKSHNLIESGDGVVVGVSGGPDSVCLLHILHTLSRSLALSLYAVHVNHMLRGEEALRDEEFVRGFCRELGIPVYVNRCDVGGMAAEKGLSVEEAGREARYRTLSCIAESVGAERIAVAHSRNDQAETILMNMLRGSGLDGLRGMEYKRDKIIRPLLDADRSEILEYCRQNGLNPVTDTSNLETSYRRNKIRLKLIPYMEELLGFDATESLLRMGTLIRDDWDFIEKTVRGLYEQSVNNKKCGKIYIDLCDFNNYHIAVRKRIVRMALEELKGDLKGLESVHINSVTNLAANGKTGTLTELPSDIRVLKSYDSLVFFIEGPSKAVPAYEYRLEIPGTTSIGETGALLKASLLTKEEGPGNLKTGESCPVQLFDYDSLTEGAAPHVRNRRRGDRFHPIGASGSKKLKDFFIDEKIPREERDSIPLVAKDNEVVWVIGYRINDKFKVTENTKNVLRLEYIKSTDGESLDGV